MGREQESEKTTGEVSGAPLQNSLKASLWREKWVVRGWELSSTVGQASLLHHYVTLGRWVDFLRPQLLHLLNGKCEHEEFKGLLWVAQILTGGCKVSPSAFCLPQYKAVHEINKQTNLLMGWGLLPWLGSPTPHQNQRDSFHNWEIGLAWK